MLRNSAQTLAMIYENPRCRPPGRHASSKQQAAATNPGVWGQKMGSLVHLVLFRHRGRVSLRLNHQNQTLPSLAKKETNRFGATPKTRQQFPGQNPLPKSPRNRNKSKHVFVNCPPRNRLLPNTICFALAPFLKYSETSIMTFVQVTHQSRRSQHLFPASGI